MYMLNNRLIDKQHHPSNWFPHTISLVYRSKPESSPLSGNLEAYVKYKAQMRAVTPTKIHANFGLLSPKPSPVPSVLRRSSTRANTGCAYARVAAEVTAVANWGNPIPSFDSFSAEHTILDLRSAGRPATGRAEAARRPWGAKALCTRHEEATAEAEAMVAMAADTRNDQAQLRRTN